MMSVLHFLEKDILAIFFVFLPSGFVGGVNTHIGNNLHFFKFCLIKALFTPRFDK